MKNVKIGLTLIGIIISFFAQAQFKLGVGGGVNFTRLSGDIDQSSSLTAYNLGLMTEFKLPVKLGIEVDILFSTKGTKDAIFFNEVGDPIGDADIRLAYVDIPIVLKLYSLKVISFQGGIQYSFLTDEESFTVSGASSNAFKTNDYAIVAGIGIDVERLHFSARYNFGVVDVSRSLTELKNNMLTLSLGIWLKK